MTAMLDQHNGSRILRIRARSQSIYLSLIGVLVNRIVRIWFFGLLLFADTSKSFIVWLHSEPLVAHVWNLISVPVNVVFWSTGSICIWPFSLPLYLIGTCYNAIGTKIFKSLTTPISSTSSCWARKIWVYRWWWDCCWVEYGWPDWTQFITLQRTKK